MDTSLSQQNIKDIWQTAPVANLLSLTNPQTKQEYGAFVITSGTPFIFSLQPTVDYEIDGREIPGWKMIFATNNNEVNELHESSVIGTAGYFETIGKLKPYIIDEQNGSILVRELSEAELLDLFQKSKGKKLPETA